MTTELEEFYQLQNRFNGLSVNDQICRFAWYTHRIAGKERFAPRDIAINFTALNLAAPAVGVYLSRLCEKKPPLILWDKKGYYLEGREMRRLDDILQPNVRSAAVSSLLRGLTNSLEDGPERVFLDEAIRCYKVAAFRAAIVMAWNLAYDHLRQWVITDVDRIQAFNEGSAKRFNKKPKIVVTKVEDFDDFKESEFIDACASGRIISKNIEDMLREKLKRRNMAAHPSKITILQPQADDVITDLVKNIVLDFK